MKIGKYKILPYSDYKRLQTQNFGTEYIKGLKEEIKKLNEEIRKYQINPVSLIRGRRYDNKTCEELIRVIEDIKKGNPIRRRR